MLGYSMELNDQQRTAVTYCGDRTNILVTAGAGCGKTRTIIARAAHLVKQGTDASRILIMTFTNRAAREIKQRLKSEVGETAESMQTGTFHAFCLKVMSRIPKSFEINGLNIIDADDQSSLMGLIRKTAVKKLQGPKRGFPSADQLLSYYSYSRNTLKDPHLYLESETDLEKDHISLCIEIFGLYQRAKEDRGYLDYDDLLQHFTEMLEKKGPLRKAVCSLFDEVLVDEMQDTNPIQFSILKHFSSEQVRLFCVGDPAQSIYRFRGAQFKHVHEFDSIFGNSIIFPLSVNYRSYQEILDFSNWLLHRSPYEYRDNLEAFRGKGNILPRVEDFEHQSDEASWIADHIVSCTESKIPMTDIMILYRSAYEARSLEAELIRRGIPYRFIGGLVLTKSAHVRDIMALLRLARNPKDDLAWMRFLQLWPRVGERTAERILETINTSDLSNDGVIRILEESFGLDNPVTSAFRGAVQSFGKPVACVKSITNNLRPILSQRYDHWQQRAKDLELLEKVAQNYRSTSQFIDDFTLEPMNDTQISNEHNDDAVTLITVHSAKGTEAPLCIVAAATQSNYPHFRSLGDLEAEEEERRVLYVACTRAKNELILTRSSFNRNAFWVEHSPAQGEPYFLQDIPKELIVETQHGWSPSTSGGLEGLQDIF
ncbi:MAG: ATP-dependent DNA helicase PcrA [Spirochaetae bacterium HGW-Spirochaetae-2]|nr:MAG: ATP-dependent DNA helicase PcrA [Spirochaetae bacterium HGW-Spirochaetae-2]